MKLIINIKIDDKKIMKNKRRKTMSIKRWSDEDRNQVDREEEERWESKIGKIEDRKMMKMKRNKISEMKIRFKRCRKDGNR